MVVAAVDVGGQRILAGMPARPVATVVAEGDRLGQRHVEAEGTGHAGGNSADIKSMRLTGALVVVTKHKVLRLAGQPAECAGVQDTIAFSLEARPPCIR